MGSADTEVVDEQDRVRLMRYKRFRALKIERTCARLLADSDADIHRAEWMFKNGATPELIFRILL